jgi:two-component system NtrC family response regulator/two-component system response regulator HydG
MHRGFETGEGSRRRVVPAGGTPVDAGMEGPPMNVMIVGADEQTARDIKAALSGCGCRITSASTPEDGLRLSARQAFDLVLLDLSLIRTDRGEALIRQFRDARPDVKIITIAAHCNRDLERAIRRHGVLFYMTKPVSPSLIRELAAHLIKSIPAAEAVPNTPSPAESNERRRPGLRRNLRIRP